MDLGILVIGVFGFSSFVGDDNFSGDDVSILFKFEYARDGDSLGVCCLDGDIDGDLLNPVCFSAGFNDGVDSFN